MLMAGRVATEGSCISYGLDGEEMKYLLILFLAAIAGIEYFHVLSSNDAPALGMCTAANDGMPVAGDVLRHHLASHR